jgi:hypothetical protein
MAKANFKCADCGAPTPTSGRNRADADRRARWEESKDSVCEDCTRKRNAAKSVQAAAENQMSGLPSLTGTPKQIAWAETIRRDRIAMTETAMGYAINGARPTDTAPNRISLCYAIEDLTSMRCGALGDMILTAMADVMRRQSAACWWIDTRGMRYQEIANTLDDEIRAELVPPAEPCIEEMDAQEEALLKPAGVPVCSQIAEISCVAMNLHVALPVKNEPFRLLMRGLLFRWNGKCWSRTMNFMTGDPAHRMAEVAHRLIAAGFMVRIHDNAARTMAMNGEFEMEQTRWVTMAGKTEKSPEPRLFIVWRKPDDFYATARRIAGSRHTRGGMICPVSSIEEVADFAEKYGFRLSKGPSEILMEHRAAIARGIVIDQPKKTPAKVVLKEQSQPPEIKAPASVEVDDELLNHD